MSKMGAPVANDRKQNARVRQLLLNEVERLWSADPLSLSEREMSRKEELLLRMAPNLLPRLNAGREDDEVLFPKPLLAGQSNVPSNNSSEETTATGETD